MSAGEAIDDTVPLVVDPALMRLVLGNFCTGVVVLTASHEGESFGFTAQSFTSLSLDPPLISVCVARSSSTYPSVRRAGRFCVNVLADHQEELSGRFASRHDDRFDGVTHAASPISGAPRLDGALAWIDCSIEAELDAGDHVIVVGRVHELAAVGAGSPLLFFRGGYHRLVEVAT